MKFFDTNVLVYVADIRDPRKQRIAEDLVMTALDSDGFLISEQVLNEFSSIALSKLKISKDAIKEYLQVFRGIPTVTFPDHVAERGLDIAERYQLQFYDSLLLATAEANGCSEFLSEDLNDGQVCCGMKVVNPFKASP